MKKVILDFINMDTHRTYFYEVLIKDHDGTKEIWRPVPVLVKNFMGSNSLFYFIFFIAGNARPNKALEVNENSRFVTRFTLIDNLFAYENPLGYEDLFKYDSKPKVLRFAKSIKFEN